MAELNIIVEVNAQSCEYLFIFPAERATTAARGSADSQTADGREGGQTQWNVVRCRGNALTQRSSP